MNVFKMLECRKFLTKSQGYEQFGYFCLMNFLKKWLDFYLDSSIHVALSVYALTRITLLQFNLPNDEAICFFTFYTTIVMYNFIKYGSLAKHYFFVTSPYTKGIQIFSFACFGMAIFYAFQLSVNTLIWAMVFGCLSVLYIIPFLPNKKNFRRLHQIKILIVALCWSGVTVVLPLVNSEQSILKTDTIIISIQRVLLVLILMIPFEINDLKFDAKELKTLPQRLGVHRTKLLAYLWCVLFFLLNFFKEEFTETQALIDGILVITLCTTNYMVSIKKSKYFTSFWVESIPILWFLLVFLL